MEFLDDAQGGTDLIFGRKGVLVTIVLVYK